ncbi:helix-turn-helix domain-containing protein [Niallia circulans]|uniref:helix-turn-helix domain-containing protein n=1 Tax=Niallia circulans TaxID=1397 RepID=UPI0026EBAE3A|nr:helix-turn-helix transcriptional regulator [Niallia circulans]
MEVEIIVEFLGSRIQNAREKKGINAKEAAKLIGVSRSTWSLYESDKRNPSVDTLKLIAENLDVSSDYLLGLKKK